MLLSNASLGKGSFGIRSFDHSLGNSNAYWDLNIIGPYATSPFLYLLLTQQQSGYDSPLIYSNCHWVISQIPNLSNIFLYFIRPFALFEFI